MIAIYYQPICTLALLVQSGIVSMYSRKIDIKKRPHRSRAFEILRVLDQNTIFCLRSRNLYFFDLLLYL